MCQELVDEVLTKLAIPHTIVNCHDKGYEYFKTVVKGALSLGDRVIVCALSKNNKLLLTDSPKLSDGKYQVVTGTEDLFRLWESCEMVRYLHIDYGKLRKCKVVTSKGSCNCGEPVCRFTGNNRCKFYSDMGGVVIVIRERVHNA